MRRAMSDHDLVLRAVADLTLTPSEAGGLRSGLPSPSRSLVLRLAGEDDINLGAVIATESSGDLEPGAHEERAILTFWADVASQHITAGQRFDLWYGRVVGGGVIVDVSIG